MSVLLLSDLVAANELTAGGDHRFFARHRHRKHRLRHASVAERTLAHVLYGPQSPPDGFVWFTAVRQVIPGILVRHTFAADAGNDHETDEDTAWALFETAQSHAARRRGVAA